MIELVNEERLKEVVYSVVGKYMNAAGGCNDELPRIGLMIARAVLEELKITKIQEVPWDSMTPEEQAQEEQVQLDGKAFRDWWFHVRPHEVKQNIIEQNPERAHRHIACLAFRAGIAYERNKESYQKLVAVVKDLLNGIQIEDNVPVNMSKPLYLLRRLVKEEKP